MNWKKINFRKKRYHSINKEFITNNKKGKISFLIYLLKSMMIIIIINLTIVITFSALYIIATNVN